MRIKEHKKEVDSFTAGIQTRASRARESSVTHKSAITDHAVEAVLKFSRSAAKRRRRSEVFFWKPERRSGISRQVERGTPRLLPFRLSDKLMLR